MSENNESKHEFKAESKRLLDLMINSIYTHKEIFLREIISNASDASDKRYYHALQKGESGLNRDGLAITITIDKDNRTLTVADKGCGMTRAELEENLGTIAKSGSLNFKKALEKQDDIDIIGQFGVGFYSAFMVSDKVEVHTKSESGESNAWISEGADGYVIEPYEKDEVGTEIIMHIKPSSEEEDYDQYLDEYKIQSLIKQYSDYIHYPIKMLMTKSRVKPETEGSEKPEYEDYSEWETLNSMVPLWKKPKNEVTDEDYHRFYHEKFHDYNDPLKVIRTSTEGAATYTALLFIPSKPEYDYYTKDYEKGLQLYSNGVLIMDKCADLLPDHFSFVKGVVDSQDLSLNISREMLQHDRQLKIIAGNLEKKIKSELALMMKNDRENYEKFYDAFGLQLKYGIYNSYGMKKDLLSDLLLFYSSTKKKMVSLAEYVERMGEEQKDIYYIVGSSIEQIDRLPQMELLKDKKYEVLYLLNAVDEFVLKVMQNYNEKNFKSVTDGDLDLESVEEKEAIQKKIDDNKEMLDFLGEALKDRVSKVVISNRLKTHPVCLSAEGNISLEMEKLLNSMPNEEGRQIKAHQVLEINGDHPIFETLCKAYKEDQEKAKDYINILYVQALLIEGFAVEDPITYCNAVCELMK